MTNNKVFCISPWIHLHTWPNNDVYPCCLTPMDYPVGNLTTHSLKEIWNSDGMKKLRNNMIKGEKSEGCKRCYAIEDAGQLSMRQSLNQKYSHHFKEAKKTEADGTYKDLNLIYWDFRFSNICNMRCRSCGPQLSTGWYEDHKKIWGPNVTDLPDASKRINLWNDILPFFDKVEEIYFAGGEPLIMEEHYRILKKLEEINRFNVTIRYNTNFSQMKYKSLNVLDIWPKFKKVYVGASLDGYGKVAEYLRKNTIWKEIVQNRLDMKEKAPLVEFYVSSTISVYNSFHVIDFHKYLLKNGLIDNSDKMYLNYVQDPEYMSIQILPKHLKDILSASYLEYSIELKNKGFNYMSSQVQSLINYMNSADKSHLISKFKEMTLKLDNIRGEDFSEVFPELKELVQ